MPDYISGNLTTIILAIVAIFALGIAVRIKIRKNRVDISNVVNQSDNVVGGDQAGRNINKRNVK